MLLTNGVDAYPWIQRYAAERDIPELMLLAMLIAESNLNPYAWRQGVWPDVSGGLSQFTVQTAGAYGIGNGTNTLENIQVVRDTLSDPELSIKLGAQHLRYCWDAARLFGEDRMLQALICYNSGSVQVNDNWYWQKYPENIANYNNAIARAKELLS